MSIDQETDSHRVRPNKTSSSKKLQLWTTQSKTKYAISFENDPYYLATSDPEVTEYTTVIAESDKGFKGYEYDWKYILNRWVENHKFSTGFKNTSKFLFPPMTPPENASRIKNMKIRSKSSFCATTLDGKKYSVKMKPYIKCHYCRLVFDSHKKRTVHEKVWHSK
jgi:hypothetical protein